PAENHNLDSGVALIRVLVEFYPYIGIVCGYVYFFLPLRQTMRRGLLLPICNFKTPSDFDYKTSCCNGDLLRIIQLGMTLCNENGRKPEGKCVWQFNFLMICMRLTRLNSYKPLGPTPSEMNNKESITNILVYFSSQPVSFDLKTSSGSMVTLVNMPVSETESLDLLETWFPCMYNIKFLMRSCKSLRGELNKVTEALNLLTAGTVFALRARYFDDELDNRKLLGLTYGLDLPGQA
ncbi:hypothetical protein PSHT_00257, partial [Puccinia striiformis]